MRTSGQRWLVLVGASLSAVVPRLASPAPGTAGCAVAHGTGDATRGTVQFSACVVRAASVARGTGDATRGTVQLSARVVTAASVAHGTGDATRGIAPLSARVVTAPSVAHDTGGATRGMVERPATIWPLRAGVRYDWRGEVAWTPQGTSDTVRRAALWTTTVHAVTTRGGRQVAVVEGLPQAMLLAKGSVEPRFGVVASEATRLWVREVASRADADSTARAWSDGRDPGDDVLLLRLPARVDDRWPDQPMKVADGFFEWTVTHVADARAVVPAVAVARDARAYEVSMHTAPEMRVVTIVPGTGIVRWWHLGFGRTQRIVLELAGVRAPRGRGG